MIVMRLSGGLGNQMWQYALGRSLAHDRGTSLVLDVDACAATEQNNFEGYCLEKAFGVQTPLLSGLRRTQVRLWKSVPWLRSRRTLEHIKVRRSDLVVEIGRNCYLSGYFQDYRYWESNASLIRRGFASIGHISVDRTWVDRIEETKSVAVHVRRGDYLSAGMLKVQGLDYYIEAMGHAEATLDESELTYFVFSDDPEWVERQFPRNRRVQVVGRSDRSSWEEMALMSRCEHFIIANSSFSWWAAWLGASTGSFVAYPFEWRKKQKLNELLVETMPIGWTSVGRPPA